MAKHAVGAAAEQIRALALGYPEAVEEFPWGHSAIKVRGKAFLFMGSEGGRLGLSCKLPASHGAALLLPFASPTGYGLGKSGWVSAEFAPGVEPPLDLLAEWIDESYRAVAPKKLAALVAARGAEVVGSQRPARKAMAKATGPKKQAKAATTKKAAKKVPAKKKASTQGTAGARPKAARASVRA